MNTYMYVHMDGLDRVGALTLSIFVDSHILGFLDVSAAVRTGFGQRSRCRLQARSRAVELWGRVSLEPEGHVQMPADCRSTRRITGIAK